MHKVAAVGVYLVLTGLLIVFIWLYQQSGVSWLVPAGLVVVLMVAVSQRGF